MAKPQGATRAAAQLVIKSAARRGLSSAETIRELADKGLSYRRTTMLADYRTAANIKEKEGLLKYVRKDRTPSPRIYAETTHALSREFQYLVAVQTRLRPGEPLEKRLVSIINDRPMTPRELDTEIRELWGDWYPERREEIVATIPETAIRRVIQ